MILRKGQKVIYKGKEVAIRGISLYNPQLTLQTTPVKWVPEEIKKYCVFDLSDGHWAWGDQIEVVKQNVHETINLNLNRKRLKKAVITQVSRKNIQ